MTSDTRRVLYASLWGTVTGGLVGFGLGLLVAPDGGQHVRQRLAYLLDRWTRQVAYLVDRLQMDDAESDARATGAALVADARERAEQLLQEADKLMEEVRRDRPAR
jgi:gas vesicle protein